MRRVFPPEDREKPGGREEAPGRKHLRTSCRWQHVGLGFVPPGCGPGTRAAIRPCMHACGRVSAPCVCVFETDVSSPTYVVSVCVESAEGGGHGEAQGSRALLWSYRLWSR